MNDRIAAIQGWAEYASEHPESAVARLRCLEGSLYPDPWSVTGWAHDELVRRGYSLEIKDDTVGHWGGLRPCRIDICAGITEDSYYYQGSTVLDCYLQAIKATEGKDEQGDDNDDENTE